MLLALSIAALTLLALLSLFVVALLRSHAEIIRRLVAIERRDGAQWSASAPPRAESRGGDSATPVAQRGPDSRERVAPPAPPLAGRTLAGDAVKVELHNGGPSLLAFLSSGCAACRPLWDGLRERVPAPAGARVLVVVKDAAQESASQLRQLASPRVELLMSTSAWRDYDVPASPHFVLVDGVSGTIAGRGAAGSWEQIVSIVEQSLADVAASGDPPAGGSRSRSTGERAERAELALIAAGIGPGHPSLYPGETSRGRPSS